MDQRKRNLFYGASPEIFKRAKALRHNVTLSERKLWQILKNKDIVKVKIRRQHPANRYILDFYCHKVKLGIEIDGKYHEGSAQKFYDKDRTSNLKELGIEIIRFTNEEVINNSDKVVDVILKKIDHKLFQIKNSNQIKAGCGSPSRELEGRAAKIRLEK